ASRSLLRVSEFIRDARLRAQGHRTHRPGETLRAPGARAPHEPGEVFCGSGGALRIRRRLRRRDRVLGRRDGPDAWQLRRKRAFSRLRGKHPESVIQDVDIPIARAPEFLAFFLEEIGILPVWICPIGGYDTQERFPLYAVDPRTLYVNFGFWDVVQDPVRREA